MRTSSWWVLRLWTLTQSFQSTSESVTCLSTSMASVLGRVLSCMRLDVLYPFQDTRRHLHNSRRGLHDPRRNVGKSLRYVSILRGIKFFLLVCRLCTTVQPIPPSASAGLPLAAASVFSSWCLSFCVRSIRSSSLCTAVSDITETGRTRATQGAHWSTVLPEPSANFSSTILG